MCVSVGGFYVQRYRCAWIARRSVSTLRPKTRRRRPVVVVRTLGLASATARLRDRGRVSRRARTFGALLLAMRMATPWAVDSPLELDEILVTGQRQESPLKLRAQSVSVITAREIEHSTATTVTDLLRQEANLNLQSYFGSDKFATVDVRGMGATATNNVLVLVDGIRLNTDDLAGADFSTIPLSQIERVEIVRGGNGVRYGNGAVGGVINLITKSAHRDARRLNLIVRRAAYDSDDLRVHAAGSWGPASIALDASDFSTDGYRHNDFLDKQDGAVDLRINGFDFITLNLRAARHDDSYGLPGPISLEEFKRSAFARRQTNRPFDRGATIDERYALAAAIDGGRFGKLDLRTTYRDRENPFFQGYNPLAAKDDQRNRTDSRAQTGEANYEYLFALGPYTQSLTVGVDFNDSVYLRQENGKRVAGSSVRRNGQVKDGGYFADLNLAAPYGLYFNLGYRRDRFSSAQNDRTLKRECDTVFVTRTVLIDTSFGTKIPIDIQVPVQSNCVTAFEITKARANIAYSEAFNTGVTWQARPWLTTFFSAHMSFRNPNVDEFLFATDDLRAQRGRGYDLGLRLTPDPRIEISATVFWLRIEHEIFFGQDAITGESLNRNLAEPTQRRGGELEIRALPLPALSLHGSVGYVRPRLTGLDADMPLVPRITSNVGAEWSVRRWAEVAISATHVGARPDGNDVTNRQFPELPSYTTVDARLRLTYRQFEAFAGINNLFDATYTTLAYSGNVYPMPDRNAYVGMRVDFF